LSPRQARWQEFLAEYDFEWEHRPGRHNQVADTLSRKAVEVVAALTQPESDFVGKLKDRAKEDCVMGPMRNTNFSHPARR
jgi:hypothetical protein